MEYPLFLLFKTLVIIFVIYKLGWFAKNYYHARRSGLPVHVVPVFTKSTLWLVLAPMLQPHLEKYLPSWIYDQIDVAIHGWEFRRKRWYHDRLGAIFAVATPDEFTIWCADPAIGTTILQNRNEFQQAPIVSSILGFLGSNVFMTNGDEWKRHRRMFNKNLDERISRVVWTETLQQAQAMINYLVEHPGNETLEGLRSIAINVIGKAGYNWQQPWSPNELGIPPKSATGKEAYFGMLGLVTTMILEAALLPRKVMQLPFMPFALQSMGYHLERAPGYIQEILRNERESDSSKTHSESNFLSLMLQFSEEENNDHETKSSLTQDEISGNLFVFTSAGFETTANTMGFAVILLALYPDWQDWVQYEIHSLDISGSDWTYENTFTKCKRTLALMFETLRLYTPVGHTTRAIFSPTSLSGTDGQIYSLTPPLDVYVEQSIIHLDPAIWGNDAMDFRPSRWIDDSGDLITPDKGTFLPWSGGPRVCPGVRFSQVEFVATMATLFRNSRCAPLTVPGDRSEDPELRLKMAIANTVTKLTLSVKDPKEVQLKWTTCGKAV
ncbi:hypothetical protein N7481_009496 [Penicillium waksmanii]|uniref:uncharacterized protein n=1 Tax=Penicillium waksmanii TaxID=69791 RepID=UPI0025480C7A|nr:uncharacterized protein N7481_009496 [Penicillium waksmanii]KAJ5975789.1 hypothetical protein N7481_009496 [Penicillium waksmanii]